MDSTFVALHWLRGNYVAALNSQSLVNTLEWLFDFFSPRLSPLSIEEGKHFHYYCFTSQYNWKGREMEIIKYVFTVEQHVLLSLPIKSNNGKLKSVLLMMAFARRVRESENFLLIIPLWDQAENMLFTFVIARLFRAKALFQWGNSSIGSPAVKS